MLKAAGICKSYPTRAGELVVLRDVDLELAPGQSIAILGPSGCGKSTLLNILGTLEPPTRGQVWLDGCEPFKLPATELARFRNTRVGLVFQDHHLLPQCTVLENVLVPTLAGRAESQAPARARELLVRVGLEARQEHLPAELSGGERQRVAIARALVNRPHLVLADEPTGNLDPATAERIGEMLAELPRTQGVILVVVTHSAALAARFERRFELVGGRLVPAGAAAVPAAR
jgi:lipoprotein-releasing system ATP-binding protein